MVLSLLKDLNINYTLDEIKYLPKQTFKTIIRRQINNKAFSYLLKKHHTGSKGKQICYEELRMRDYLLPNNIITLEDQRYIFSLRCRMNNISSNFTNEHVLCETDCGEILNNEHIYNCEVLNKGIKPDIIYNKKYNGFLKDKVKVLKHMERNILHREQFLKTLSN